jgi:hypothetical protein
MLTPSSSDTLKINSSDESCLFDNYFCDKFAAGVWSTPHKVPQLSIPINISRHETYPVASAETPGPSDLTDEKLLNRAFEKARFKNIQIEKVKVTFKFDTAEDYTKFTQDITTLLMVW